MQRYKTRNDTSHAEHQWKPVQCSPNKQWNVIIMMMMMLLLMMALVRAVEMCFGERFSAAPDVQRPSAHVDYTNGEKNATNLCYDEQRYFGH